MGSASALMGIVLVVLGGIYLGVFTPVEAAAVGAFSTFVLMVIRRRVNFESMKFCVLETIKTFAMVYLILIGAFIFNPFWQLPNCLPTLPPGSGRWSWRRSSSWS